VPTDAQHLSTVDIVALVHHYGHLTDAREWDRYGEVFTVDVVVDASDLRMPPMVGLRALIEVFEGANHPVAHHMTNVVVDWDEDEDSATVRTKWLGVRDDGTVGTGDYLDTVVRGNSGWRISGRTVTMRRQRALPATSRGGSLSSTDPNRGGGEP